MGGGEILTTETLSLHRGLLTGVPLLYVGFKTCCLCKVYYGFSVLNLYVQIVAVFCFSNIVCLDYGSFER